METHFFLIPSKGVIFAPSWPTTRTLKYQTAYGNHSRIADDIARHLGQASEMPRQMLEAFVAEAYRAQQLSRRQLSQLLGFDYWQTEEFLTQHEAKRPFTMEDLQIDRQTLASLPQK
ncbi:MAG TPA: UPF0175 family protein [Verrucomicrobiae bacterium]